MVKFYKSKKSVRNKNSTPSLLSKPKKPTHTPNPNATSTTTKFNRYLAAGKALGSIIFKTTIGKKQYRFRCTNDCIGGRGLRIVDKVGNHTTIARGLGTIYPISDSIYNKTSFKLHDTKRTVMVLAPPTTAMPANLANTTASKTSKNNCKLVHKPGTSFFSIVTTRKLEPGEEVTVPYGNKFTKAIADSNNIASINTNNYNRINCNTKLPCPVCKHLILKRKLPRHTNSIVCKNYLSKSLSNK